MASESINTLRIILDTRGPWDTAATVRYTYTHVQYKDKY